MNEKKQLECQLYCVATASLSKEVAEDMGEKDGNLKELLENESDKNNSKDVD